jgi:hypothetical protein
MTNPAKVLIDVPTDKGVHVKSAGEKGEKYVYKHTHYYRNKDGKPRNKSKLIGKIDVESGKIIPNDNYYDIFNVTPEFQELSVWWYGYTYIVQKACKDMGLMDCLLHAFGNQSNEIVAIAAFMIHEGNAMDGIDDFQERNLIQGLSKSLSSQSCSKLFGSISSQQTNTFFNQLVKIALKNDTVCYDVTSVSSYSKNITDVEYGYNRDGEHLPQFNIGMFCCETSKLPLYYNRYNGSLTDKTNLSHVLANAGSVGIKNVKLVLDGGFMSADCYQSLNEAATAFTIGVPASLDISKDMINKYINDITSYANKITK